MSLGRSFMNGRKAKLLRKIATLTGRSDKYIKKEYKQMPLELQASYLAYMRDNLKRIAEMRKQSSSTPTIDSGVQA
jgi:hypothetical protein